jgi:hypothetical protein
MIEVVLTIWIIMPGALVGNRDLIKSGSRLPDIAGSKKLREL